MRIIIFIPNQGDETKIVLNLFNCLPNILSYSSAEHKKVDKGRENKVCVESWQLLIQPGRLLLKTHSQYLRDGAEWSTSFLFMAQFSLRESLLAVCGSLPVVIACYQPLDTQTWEVLQGSPAHKHCSGVCYRFAS